MDKKCLKCGLRKCVTEFAFFDCHRKQRYQNCKTCRLIMQNVNKLSKREIFYDLHILAIVAVSFTN